MVAKFAAGDLTFPGHDPATAGPPEDVLETAPPTPVLNIATFVHRKSDVDGKPRSIKVPKSVVDKWYNHETYGAEFRAFCHQLIEVFGADCTTKI